MLKRKGLTSPNPVAPPVVAPTANPIQANDLDLLRFNLAELVDQPPVIFKGVTLFVLPLNVISVWVGEIRKFLNRPPKVVIAHS